MPRRPREIPARAGTPTLALALLLVAAPALAGPPIPYALESVISSVRGLDPKVLALALRASSCAQHLGMIPESDTLTVIDYSRPSTEPRLYVLDVERGVLLNREWVAHGKGSGGNLTRRFSNEPGSRSSSLGLFVTRDAYVGLHGPSLRLDGLEPGINDRAYERAIVLHGASYVSWSFISEHGRLGRSWGCPALASEVAERVIERIRGGTPLFAYYPDPSWLAHSPFLGACESSS